MRTRPPRSPRAPPPPAPVGTAPKRARSRSPRPQAASSGCGAAPPPRSSPGSAPAPRLPPRAPGRGAAPRRGEPLAGSAPRPTAAASMQRIVGRRCRASIPRGATGRAVADPRPPGGAPAPRGTVQGGGCPTPQAVPRGEAASTGSWTASAPAGRRRSAGEVHATRTRGRARCRGGSSRGQQRPPPLRREAASAPFPPRKGEAGLCARPTAGAGPLPPPQQRGGCVPSPSVTRAFHWLLMQLHDHARAAGLRGGP